MKKVLAAMSGGVDSSVTAVMLKNAGYLPYGVTMELLCGIRGVTPSEEYRSAESVCETLGIPFRTVDLSREFEEHVIKPFAESYLAGETPNPCVECNRFLKFGALLKLADSMGLDYIATGHYARIEEADGMYRVRKAADLSKDQSYVLCTLTQEQLRRVILPLGGMTKTEVRAIAEKSGLPTAHKKESQDICFIKNEEYFDFLKRYADIDMRRGSFIDSEGKVIGTHAGSIRYTVGQRRGLGMGFSERMYVISKNMRENTITLGSDEMLYTDTVMLRSVNVISGIIPDSPFRAAVKIRYLHREQPATVYPVPGEGVRFKIVFDTPVRAPAPGQWGVMYDGEYMTGGGIIE